MLDYKLIQPLADSLEMKSVPLLDSRATILVIAENFAFGPVGILLTIAPSLKKKGYRLIFLGYGTAYQLARREACFDEIHLIDTSSDDFIKKASWLFQKADAVLSVDDRPTIQLAKKLHKPTIWIDMLLYYWDTLPSFLWSADL